MKHIKLLVCAALLVTQLTTRAQGTLTITFDGPPFPFGSSAITYYTESGMAFRPPTGNNGFLHTESRSPFPDNGTLYLQGGGHSGYNSVSSGFVDGSTFGVASIDLAGLSTSSPNYFAQFGAVRSDGSYLFLNVSGTGIDFQTVHFGPEWSSGLVGFGISNGSSPDGWSVDNLVVSIPEPGTGVLLFIGAVAALAFWKRKRLG